MSENNAPDGVDVVCTFAQNLRERMKEKGETQESIAKKVGVKRQTISLYQKGISKPDIEVLYRIANALDVTSDWLIGLTADRSRTPAAADELNLDEWYIYYLKLWGDAARACEDYDERNLFVKVLLDAIIEHHIDSSFASLVENANNKHSKEITVSASETADMLTFMHTHPKFEVVLRSNLKRQYCRDIADALCRFLEQRYCDWNEAAPDHNTSNRGEE